MHTDERILLRDVSNTQTATEIPADSELDQGERPLVVSLHSFIAQNSPLDAPSEDPSKWGDEGTLRTSVASVSGCESYQQLLLTRFSPESNYSYEKTDKASDWGDDSALGISTASASGYESYLQLPLKRSLPEPSYLHGNPIIKKHKPNPPAGITPLPTVMPENLGFLWSVDSIEVIYDEKHPRRQLMVGSIKSNDVAKIWSPPNRAKMFTRHAGNLYRWRMGESEQLENYTGPKKKFAVTSLFFQAKQNNFVAINKDCTRCDVAAETFGWSYIGFEHNSGNLSEVCIAGSHDLLAAPADGSSWMPQVLPHVYNYDTKSPWTKPPPGSPGGLCGSLSLIVGMAAFSAEARNAESVISSCFGLRQWRKHQFEIGIGRKYSLLLTQISPNIQLTFRRLRRAGRPCIHFPRPRSRGCHSKSPQSI